MCTENHYWHHDYIRLAWDSGFAFNTHKTKSIHDWSSIGLLDVDRIIRDRDVAAVEKHIGTVLNYCLDEEQTKILEPTFVKVFQLGQLSLQYLQFCKRYLDNTVVLLKKEVGRHKQENSNLKGNIDALKQEINELKKSIKEIKEPQPLQQPVVCAENNVVPSFKCSVCCKMFISEEFLVAHFKRRHEVDTNPFQTETDRLQLEIKELKERLNSTEKYIQSDSNLKTETKKIDPIPNNDAVIENVTYVDDLKEKFDHLKRYVEQELTVLRQEKHYQEKYEKWFEMVFQRLDSSKNELQGKQDIPSSERLICKESSTQTVMESCVESETMTDEPIKVPSQENIVLKPVVAEIDVKKIQNDIRRDTEDHFEQIQGVLEKKLSGGFEQIQTQMNTFWKKLSDMELEKKSNNNSHLVISSGSSESIGKSTKPIPAPRIIKTAPVGRQSKSEVRAKDKVTPSIRKPMLAKPIITQEIEGTSSEETSSDDDSIEIVKPTVQKPVTHKPKPFSMNVVKSHKKDVAARKFSSSNESEDEKQMKEPQVKQSTSTLGQRSLTSLKQTMKDDDVIKGLNKELREMVAARLREIGISPTWKGIPEKSYNQAIRVVRHQTDLSRKRYPNYNKVREVLLKILEDRVQKEKESIGKYKKYKAEKIVMIKQPKNKLQKHSKKTKHDTYLIDTNSETTKSKVNITNIKPAKKFAEKQNPTQEFANTLSSALTPVKKKVLFDLEDSSSTSKPALNGSESKSSQYQGDHEMNRQQISNNPLRKPEPREGGDATQITAQKTPQKVLKIDDGGSTSSLASSEMLTAGKPKVPENKAATKEDISDWDISDILT